MTCQNIKNKVWPASVSRERNFYTTTYITQLHYIQLSKIKFLTDLQGRGVEVLESRSDENISTPLSCQSVIDSK